jgi:hypothetical protein
VKRENLSFLETAAEMLRERGGYRTEIWRLNASAFGVPQDRMRCFLVASRTKMMPARPPEEYQDLRKPNLDLDALPPVRLQEAIFDLPEQAAGDGLAVEGERPPIRRMTPGSGVACRNFTSCGTRSCFTSIRCATTTAATWVRRIGSQERVRKSGTVFIGKTVPDS